MNRDNPACELQAVENKKPMGMGINMPTPGVEMAKW